MKDIIILPNKLDVHVFMHQENGNPWTVGREGITNFENQKEIKDPTLFQNNLPQMRPFDFPLIYR